MVVSLCLLPTCSHVALAGSQGGAIAYTYQCFVAGNNNLKNKNSNNNHNINDDSNGNSNNNKDNNND